MKKIITLFLMILSIVTFAGKPKNYDNKKINAKRIDKIVKSNDKIYSKELIGWETVTLEDGTYIGVTYKKYVRDGADTITSSKIGIIYTIHGEGYVKEIYYFNKDYAIIKATSETYAYQGNGEYALKNRIDVYFIDYTKPMVFVNGKLSNPPRDAMNMMIFEMKRSVLCINLHFNNKN